MDHGFISTIPTAMFYTCNVKLLCPRTPTRPCNHQSTTSPVTARGQCLPRLPSSGEHTNPSNILFLSFKARPTCLVFGNKIKRNFERKYSSPTNPLPPDCKPIHFNISNNCSVCIVVCRKKRNRHTLRQLL